MGNTRANSAIAGFTVDDDLMSMLRALDVEEKESLLESIRDEGIRDPVLLWNGVVIDGHQRLIAAEKLKLKKIPRRELKFSTKAEALRWMYRNQLGRRNQNADQRAMMAAKFDKAIAEAEKEKAIAQSDVDSETGKQSDFDQVSAERTSARSLAEQANIGKTTAAQAIAVANDGIPKLVAAVVEGKIGLKEAAKIAKEPKSRQRQKLARGETKATEPKPENPKDELGEPVPSDLLEAFAARDLYDKALNLLTNISATINPLLGDPQKGQKPIAGGEHLAPHRLRVETAIKDLRSCVRFAKPYAPCPLSHKSGKCQLCGGSGYVTKELHERSGVK